MIALQVNPHTGFLESPSMVKCGFNSDKKVKVIELVKQCAELGKWPRLSTICKLADVGITTVREHLISDPEFKLQFEEAMAPVEDNLVDNLYKQGQNANGITANIFLLKTRWPERWGEKMVNFSVDADALKHVMGRSSQVIDAELVDKPSIESRIPDDKNVI